VVYSRVSEKNARTLKYEESERPKTSPNRHPFSSYDILSSWHPQYVTCRNLQAGRRLEHCVRVPHEGGKASDRIYYDFEINRDVADFFCGFCRNGKRSSFQGLPSRNSRRIRWRISGSLASMRPTRSRVWTPLASAAASFSRSTSSPCFRRTLASPGTVASST